MNVVFCGNISNSSYKEEYLDIAVYSILSNTLEEVNLYIFCAKWYSTISLEVLCLKFPNAHFNRINIELEELHFFENKSTKDYIKVETFLRILLPDLLPNLNKVIYLDTDVIINKDLKELWNFDLGTNIIGMVEYYKIAHIVLRKDSDVRSFNAGVVLMDLRGMRKFSFVKKCKSSCSKQLRLTGTIEDNDQGLLNQICSNRIASLPWYFNFLNDTFGQAFTPAYQNNQILIDNERYIKKLIGEELFNQVCIYHYAGPLKAWDRRTSLYYTYKDKLLEDTRPFRSDEVYLAKALANNQDSH